MQHDEQTKTTWDSGLMRRLFRYSYPHFRLVLAGIFLIILSSFLGLFGPYLTKIAIDQYIRPGDMAGLNRILLVYLALLVVSFAIHYSQGIITQLLGQRVMYDLRSQIFGHFQKLTLRFYDQNPVGRLMTRITSDVDALNQMFTQGVVSIFGDVFLLGGIIIVMLSMNWRLALWIFMVIPVLFAITLTFQSRVRQAFSNIRKWLAQINTYLQENITGIQVIQVFNRQQINAENFRSINSEHTKAHIRTIQYYAVFFPLVELISAVALAAVIWRGGLMKISGLTSFGALVAFIQYAQMFFRPISDLSEKYNILLSAMASSERIFKLLDTRPDILPTGTFHSKEAPVIRFDQVWFAYEPENYVLKNLNLAIQPGQSVAVVGHTGAGKTSLINILSRQYDIQRGSVLVAGRDIREWDLSALRKKMAVVLQDVFLFSGSVYENVALGHPEITAEMVEQACKEVHLHDFIQSLPAGYETEVRERGAALSMGQRQLLSFARALVSNPEILILDEATSSIDTETEQLVQDALQRIMHGRTSIVIAHRLSTIRHADRIFVLHRGELKEQGNHEALLAERGLYYQLYRLQFQEQELV